MNSNLYKNISIFLKKRTFEFIGLTLVIVAIALAFSFISYSPNDPSFIYGEKQNLINNYLGIYGSLISDFLLQSFGLVSFLLLITIISWGIILMINKELNKIILKIFFIILYIVFGCVFININFNNSFWLIDNGNSGFVGQIIYNFSLKYFSLSENQYFSFALLILTIIFFSLSSEFNFIQLLRKVFLLIYKLFQPKKIYNENTLSPNL